MMTASMSPHKDRDKDRDRDRDPVLLKPAVCFQSETFIGLSFHLADWNRSSLSVLNLFNNADLLLIQQ